MEKKRKSLRKKTKRDKTPQRLENELRIDDALNAGCASWKMIVEYTQLKESTVKNIIYSTPELKAKYKNKAVNVMRVAKENIINAILDPKHPKNIMCSMKFLETYKNELDEVLQSKNGVDISIGGDDGGKENGGINIVFKK